MADVTIKYKDNKIAELNESGTKTLTTSGCYCDGDVTVSYTPRIDDTFRHWDVAVSGTISSNLVNILQDDWLKQHRADANLCIALIPQFVIQHTSGKGNQGIYLSTNSVFAQNSSGTSYKSLSVYVHSNGNLNVRGRTVGLTTIGDVGDLHITSDGKLQAVAKADYPIIPGEYCVIACLM